jgi:biopolymer transport protein TolR
MSHFRYERIIRKSYLAGTRFHEDAVTPTARYSAEPNITPMIDVLLVLLITFMVAVVQVWHTLDAQLPQECTTACSAGDAIVLDILPGPSYQLNQQPIEVGSLEERLRAVYRDRPEKIIHVSARPGVRYKDVIAAMDVAKSAGVRVLSLVPKSVVMR